MQAKDVDYDFTKRSTVYWITILIWILSTSLLTVLPLVRAFETYDFLNAWIITLLIVNACFSSYFWLSGFKDIIYFWTYHFIKRPELRGEKQILQIPLPKKWRPKVLLLYTTCNDFIPGALAQSMQQTYSNCQTVILDDSQDVHYRRQIDRFKHKHHGVKVIRRQHHVGFKAGNLNHFLLHYHDYDYFVLLDSDELIPHDFVIKALHYFVFNPKMGILQCIHTSDRNQNYFMSLFSRGSNSFWGVYNTVKMKYGFLSLLGHGAMVSRKDYEKVNGFPLVVAEDLCFSVESRLQNFQIGFSNLIVCREEFPIDYIAFKKRQSKWTAGNWEFIRKYTRRIFLSHRIHWYEKLDLLIFVYSLSIYALLYGSVIICSIILPYLQVGYIYSLWMWIPMLWCYFAQTINDAFMQLKLGYPLRKLPMYMVNTMVLYGSMYWTTVKVTFSTIMGHPAKFVVTPKTDANYSWRNVIHYNWPEFVFGLVTSLAAILFSGSYWILMTFLPGMFGGYLTLFSNHQDDHNHRVVKLIRHNNYEGQHGRKVTTLK